MKGVEDIAPLRGDETLQPLREHWVLLRRGRAPTEAKKTSSLLMHEESSLNSVKSVLDG